MLKSNAIRCLFLLLFLCNMSQAQNAASSLQKNPFSQPETLKAPVQRTVREPDRQAEQAQAPVTDFILTATLISVNEPMAVVNGELLTMGEETNGMRLILVDEGRAVIRYEGKIHDLSIGENESQKPPQTGRR